MIPALMLTMTATTAAVATTSVKIPPEGWTIAFDSPSLLNAREETTSTGDYAFSANAGRLNLSLFVERPRGPGATNLDCYNYYWPLAARNPMIDKQTVSPTRHPTYVRVQYDVVTAFQGQSIRQRHVNYYFAFRGRWVDVHLSVIEPTTQDERWIELFDGSLRYGQ